AGRGAGAAGGTRYTCRATGVWGPGAPLRPPPGGPSRAGAPFWSQTTIAGSPAGVSIASVNGPATAGHDAGWPLPATRRRVNPPAVKANVTPSAGWVQVVGKAAASVAGLVPGGQIQATTLTEPAAAAGTG